MGNSMGEGKKKVGAPDAAWELTSPADAELLSTISTTELIHHIQSVSSTVQALPWDGKGLKLKGFLNTLKSEAARRNIVVEVEDFVNF